MRGRRLVALLGVLALGAGLKGQAEPITGPPPLAVRFAGTGTWSFGDGSSAQATAPTHTYQCIGNYKPVLQVGRERWSTDIRVRIDRTVAVAAAGGGAVVRFRAQGARPLRIRMEGDRATQPYGFLEWAGGSRDCPANDQAHDGHNLWEGPAPASADYSLTVFDGANVGGQIRVVVEEPSALLEPAAQHVDQGQAVLEHVPVGQRGGLVQ